MEYTQLGRTGLTVSRLALGCMSFGSSKWRPWVLDEPAAKPFFRKAIEAGINFFDTADMYSLGASEEVTGRALKEYANRDEIVLATKLNFPMTSGPNMGGLSRKHVVQACEASLKRLGVDVIDLYWIHRFDEKTPIDETLEALNDLVRWGKVRYLGASSGPAWRMAQALETSEKNGWSKFVGMQNHYNLLYREEEREMIPLCLNEGVGLVPWSPLARGLLARSRPASKARGVSMAEVALAWLMSRPGVAAPIVGATKAEHLDTALKSLSINLTDDECVSLEAPYRPHGVRGYAFPEPARAGVPKRG